jgi:capsular exopolysaccharide synthesis family protein
MTADSNGIIGAGEHFGVNRPNPRADLRPLSPIPLVATPVDEGRTSPGILGFWRVLRKRGWQILGVAVVGIAVGVAVTLLTTPVFRAVTTIEIDLEPAKQQTVGNQQAPAYDDPEKYYLTEYELLKSRTLAERVVQREGLADNSLFLDKGVRRAANARPPANRSVRVERAVNLLTKGLRIDPVRASRLVKISYDSADPALAAQIANAVADSFISWNLERRFDASAAARRFLEDRLAQTRQTLEASQRRGDEYAQQNRLITIGGDQAADGGQSSTGESITATDLASINRSLSEATAARIQAEQHWRQAQATPDMSLPEILADASFREVRSTRDAAVAEYQQNLKLYKPSFPVMQEAMAKIDALNQQMVTLAQAIKSSLEAQYQFALRNEEELKNQVEEKKNELLQSQSKRVEQGFINTDINTSRALYDSMLASYKQIGISGAVEENNISFVDKAQAPREPVVPQPVRNIALFGALGLAIGAALAFLMEQFDLSMKSPEDIEKNLQLPVLGIVPMLKPSLPPARALENPKSSLSEAYYSLRAALQLSTTDGVPSTLLITSSVTGEGKSTSALAIATGFGRLGLRVLLIDADMRAPSLYRTLACANDVGLSNVLAGGVDADAAIQPTSHASVWLRAAGPPPPNPSELLAGGKMRELLAAQSRCFDLIVIDSPPVMGLADTPQLAAMVKGVIMVVEAAATRRDTVRMAVKRLQASHARILGVLFMKFDAKNAAYGYGYGYGYGYADAYGDADAKRRGAGRPFTPFALFGGRRAL